MHQELVDHVGNPLGTSWEHLGSEKNPGQKKRKKKKTWDLRCMLPHLIGWKNLFFLPTGVLCHFWPRLMARA